jgi:hypothetical protein
MTLLRRGGGSDSGHVYGDLYDFLLYREKVLSSTEVTRHFTNKWTTANIAFGEVAVSNYTASYSVVVAGVSFTATSFSSTSFTT